MTAFLLNLGHLSKASSRASEILQNLDFRVFFNPLSAVMALTGCDERWPLFHFWLLTYFWLHRLWPKLASSVLSSAGGKDLSPVSCLSFGIFSFKYSIWRFPSGNVVLITWYEYADKGILLPPKASKFMIANTLQKPVMAKKIWKLFCFIYITKILYFWSVQFCGLDIKCLFQ